MNLVTTVGEITPEGDEISAAYSRQLSTLSQRQITTEAKKILRQFGAQGTNIGALGTTQ